MFCLLEDFVQKIRRDCKMDGWIAGCCGSLFFALLITIVI
jgi:hypothetical protein